MRILPNKNRLLLKLKMIKVRNNKWDKLKINNDKLFFNIINKS